MSLEARIDLAGQRIRVLAERLAERGYEFERPDEVFPGPDPEAALAITRIEREAGKLPLAVKLFWLRVGSVDFCGSHSDWEAYPDYDSEGYPDPLVVFPPSFALQELDEFLGDREERLRCGLPFVVPIAPDDKHKANVSGGMWYNVTVPALADDPPLNDEWHGTTFLNYLEIALNWAGFPGLERHPKHTWPIAGLIG